MMPSECLKMKFQLKGSLKQWIIALLNLSYCGIYVWGYSLDDTRLYIFGYQKSTWPAHTTWLRYFAQGIMFCPLEFKDYWIEIACETDQGRRCGFKLFFRLEAPQTVR
ncbi:uncharacterized protein LOC109810501 isoform X3 [Cajanus cajan]|uniref:uncharacterized protein LOC109810501 isoform X3 n=1 Tax=Cajanus cajan TaxID=3821 RepID=UPI00098D9368|nr:uncharacterized protein LOC109810501 isoform X3 [Cajanus cajan]